MIQNLKNNPAHINYLSLLEHKAGMYAKFSFNYLINHFLKTDLEFNFNFIISLGNMKKIFNS